MLRQDNPSKCTAAKLVRFGLAERIRHIGYNTIILDPFSKEILLRQDRRFHSICAIDCSWEKAGVVFSRDLKYGKHRRLPAMLAANPTNYSKLRRLSSVEALAGSLFILGYEKESLELLNKFKWGPNFLQMNYDLLCDYRDANSSEDVSKTELVYFGQLY